MDSFERFEEKEFPNKECFFSSTKKEKIGDDGKKLDGHISDIEYLTCKEFDIKNMGDYHDHYLKKGVLLLAYVFETFIDTGLKFYRLDPCHYFSSPGYGSDEMLKMAGVKLEKISDIDMYLFTGKGIREGISYIATRYAKANNKYVKAYDLKIQSKFIAYLDMNNLYGWAMSGYLPYGGFKWLKNVDGFDVNSIGEKSPIGYILEKRKC